MEVFKDKVAAVTGAGSGIGRALGEKLAGLGADVILSDLNRESLESAIQAIRSSGGKAEGELVDVTDYEAFKQHLEGIASRKGRLDYLFNNAGISIAAEFRDMELEYWRKVVDVNLNGVFHGSQLAYRQMMKQGSGHIVNISSVEGLLPFPSNAAYVASKYAVFGLSQSMWVEGHRLGIRVSAVCPAYIKTPIFDVSPVINIDREKMKAQYSIHEKLGISPERCAGIILRGVASNKPIIPVTVLAHLLWILARLSPVGVMKSVRNGFDRWRDTVRVP